MPLKVRCPLPSIEWEPYQLGGGTIKGKKNKKNTALAATGRFKFESKRVGERSKINEKCLRAQTSANKKDTCTH